MHLCAIIQAMYRPHTEYRHRPYKSSSRSSADVFFVCIKVYIIVFTLIGITRWLSSQPGFEFHRIVIRGNHAVAVADIEQVIREPMQGKLLWIWNKDNALLYPTRTVRSRIESIDQRIASVAVHTSRNQVVVNISEYHPAFRYCLSRLDRSNGNTLLVPTAGVASDLASGSIPVSTTTPSPLASSTPLTTMSPSSTLAFTAGEQLSSGLLELPSPDTIGIDTHDCYWADDRGYIYAKAPQYSGSPLLTITESDPSRNATLLGPTPVGTFIFSDNDFAHLNQAIDLLHSSGFVLRRVVRMQSSDVVLDIGYPWNLVMNIKDDPKSALQHFFLGLKELGVVATGEKSQLRVIDVRFGNKVFYR